MSFLPSCCALFTVHDTMAFFSHHSVYLTCRCFFFCTFLSFFPLSSQKSDLDIEVEEDAGDEHYMSILSEHIPRLVKQVQPDLIFYQVMCRTPEHSDILVAKKVAHANIVISGYTS